MPRVGFVKNFPSFSVAHGSNLMKELLAAGRPVASSCGGDGVCGKCKLRIVEGAENLSAISDKERFLLDKESLKPGVRMSCQTTVQGDVVVDASYW